MTRPIQSRARVTPRPLDESRALATASLDVVRRLAASALDQNPGADLTTVLRVAGYEQVCGHLHDAERRLHRALAMTDDPRDIAALEGQLTLGQMMGSPVAPAPRRPAGTLDDATAVRWIVVERFEELFRDGDGTPRSWDRHVAGVVDAVQRMQRLAERGELGDHLDLGLHVTLLAACSDLDRETLAAAAIWRDAVLARKALAWLPLVDFVDADAARAAGDLERADELLRRSLPGLRMLPAAPWRHWAEARALLVGSYLADPANLHDPGIATAAIAESPEVSVALAYGALPLARALLTVGDPIGAGRALGTAGEFDDAVAALGSLDKARFLEIAGLVAAARGDRKATKSAIRRAESLMASPVRDITVARLRSVTIRRGTSVADARAEAIRVSRERGSDLEQLHSRLLFLLNSLEGGDRRAALHDLAELDRTAAATGARGVRSRAITALRTLQRSAHPALALAARELDVAALAAQGLSNREIGSRLFLAERTIDAYMTRVLRATGSTRRVQLAAVPGLTMGPIDPAAVRAAVQRLTSRQSQVAILAATGATNVEIADALRITEGVVERHLQAAGRRLGERTRSGIARSVVAALHER